MINGKWEHWYEKIGKKILITIALLFVLYIVVRLHIIRLFAPFILAWIFAMMLNPIVTWANKKIKIPRGIGTIFSMLFILSGILSLILWIVRKLWEQIINFKDMFPQMSAELIHQFETISEVWAKKLQIFPGAESITNIDSIIEQIMESLGSTLSSAIPTIYGGISKVPDVIIFIVMMLLATFFMTKDYYSIKDFVKAQFSDTIIDKIVIMQRGVIDAIGGYVRTQLILMSITFTVCLIGLFIFNVQYALLLSVIIAIVDALPVFGSGTVLIPWALYNLLIGHYSLGIGLLGIYGVIFITRQVMEPRILSSQIGVYALVTIMAVYIGYKTIGFLGLIVGPALVVILQMLQNVGAIPNFKPVKKSEYKGDYNEEHTSNPNH